jgi:hypothetical protein
LRLSVYLITYDFFLFAAGTWPAFWMVGPNWPNGGEIDIIEGVNTNNADQVRSNDKHMRVRVRVRVRCASDSLFRVVGGSQTTLHTSQGCDMSGEDRSAFTGDMVSTNCWVNAPNQGNNQVHDTHDTTRHDTTRHDTTRHDTHDTHNARTRE